MNGEPLDRWSSTRAQMIASNGRELEFEVERAGRGSRAGEPVSKRSIRMSGINRAPRIPRRPSPAAVIGGSVKLPFIAIAGVRRRPRQRHQRADRRRLSPARSRCAPGDELPPLRVDAVLSLLARLGVEIGFFAGLIAGAYGLVRSRRSQIQSRLVVRRDALKSQQRLATTRGGADDSRLLFFGVSNWRLVFILELPSGIRSP